MPDPDSTPHPQLTPSRSGIILDEKGNIYLLDPRTNALRRIDPDGGITLLSGPSAPLETRAPGDVPPGDPSR